MSYEAKAAEMGIPLDVEPPASNNPYLPFVRVDRIVYLSGRTSADPRSGTVVPGKLGQDMSVEQGQQAARMAMVNCVLSLRQVVGSLDKVERIIRITGYVNATPEFDQQPNVMNAASSLLIELFGEQGRHARTAIGVASLPRGAAVEVEMIAELAESEG